MGSTNNLLFRDSVFLIVPSQKVMNSGFSISFITNVNTVF